MRSADYFSTSAEAYASFRPSYPDTLIGHVASVAPGRDLAWDCATGNGQAAVPLADWFARVVATDASATQLAHARPHPRVEYRLASAAASGLSAASVDLVSVAQALHWLDLEAFYAEVRRVLRPDGVLAAWCYGRCRVAPDIDPVIDWFYQDRVGRYWPPERVHTETAYRDLPFPFDELSAGHWEMTASLTRAELLGYFGTWSAVAVAAESSRSIHSGTANVVHAAFRPERRSVTWPLALRIGRPRQSP
jgi:SAM-dependent methyltransferase